MNKELTTTGTGFVNAGDFKQQQNLLDRAARLNKLSEVSQVALGMVLSEIKRTEAFKPEYEDFKSYYQSELGRTKGDVSKLLTVGQLMLDGGFSEATVPDVGYTKLYVAYQVFPDKDVKYLVATAQTNTISEMMDNRRDDAFSSHGCTGAEIRVIECDTCGKWTKV